MKRRAFSFIEIIISLSIILFLLIPTLKINTQQIFNFKKIDEAINETDFFNAIYSYLRNEKIFITEDNYLTFKNYNEIKNNSLFTNFEFSNFSTEAFNLKVDIKFSITDFYSSKIKTNIIEIEFLHNKKQIKGKIIKFED